MQGKVGLAAGGDGRGAPLEVGNRIEKPGKRFQFYAEITARVKLCYYSSIRICINLNLLYSIKTV